LHFARQRFLPSLTVDTGARYIHGPSTQPVNKSVKNETRVCRSCPRPVNTGSVYQAFSRNVDSSQNASLRFFCWTTINVGNGASYVEPLISSRCVMYTTNGTNGQTYANQELLPSKLSQRPRWTFSIMRISNEASMHRLSFSATSLRNVSYCYITFSSEVVVIRTVCRVAPQRRDRVVTRDYYDDTSPYVHLVDSAYYLSRHRRGGAFSETVFRDSVRLSVFRYVSCL